MKNLGKNNPKPSTWGGGSNTSGKEGEPQKGMKGIKREGGAGKKTRKDRAETRATKDRDT